MPPREALTSSLRLQLTLQVTCDPQDTIAGIPPSKGVIHGSCGSNLAFAVAPFLCCSAALLLCCFAIFATAPAPHLLSHYHFYLLTTYFFFIKIQQYAMGPDPGLSVPKFLLSSTTLLTHLLIVNMEDYIYLIFIYKLTISDTLNISRHICAI